MKIITKLINLIVLFLFTEKCVEVWNSIFTCDLFAKIGMDSMCHQIFRNMCHRTWHSVLKLPSNHLFGCTWDGIKYMFKVLFYCSQIFSMSNILQVFYLRMLGDATSGDSIRAMVRKVGTNRLWGAFRLRDRKGKIPMENLPICRVFISVYLYLYVCAEVKLPVSYVDRNILYVHICYSVIRAPITNIYNGNIFYFIHTGAYEGRQSGPAGGPGINSPNS